MVLCSLLWVTLLQQGVGLGDPQRALPTPTMLGFCDSVTSSLKGWRRAGGRGFPRQPGVPGSWLPVPERESWRAARVNLPESCRPVPALAPLWAAPAGTAAVPARPPLAAVVKGCVHSQHHDLCHKLTSQRKPTFCHSFTLADVWPRTAVPVPSPVPLLALFPGWETVPGAGSGTCQAGHPTAGNAP